MKKAAKWIGILLGVLILVVIIALLVIPRFVDIQKYKPRIEQKVSEAVGRPFRIEGDLHLSLFPWAGVRFSDLHLGNPPGYEEKDLVYIKSFDVQVKLLPLISKDIQVKRFVVEGPRIVLERTKEGRGGWEGLSKNEGKGVSKAPGKAKEGKKGAEGAEGLPIKGLAIGNFSVQDGSLLWIDHAKGEKRSIKGLNLQLENVSLERPVQIKMSAQLDGKPLSVQGTLGPVGKEPGKGPFPLDLALKAFQEISLQLKGRLADLTTRPQFDLKIQLAPFSPRKLMEDLGRRFPVRTTDPKALTRLGFQVQAKGNPAAISLKEGLLELDGSKLLFSAQAKEFSKPNLQFDLKLDQMDLDRYLPPSAEKEGEGKGPKKAKVGPKKKTDYTPLRRLVLDGRIRADKLKMKGLRIQDLLVKVVGRNGILQLNPLKAKLYEGGISATGTLDVRKERPKTQVSLEAEKIQAQPLLKDMLQKDFLAGNMQAKAKIRLEGDDPEKIKKTLDGGGELTFTDGAIVGIDLADMVRNVKASFGLAEKAKEKPRTDFSELVMPFTLKRGVFHTPNTRLLSPLLRVRAAGDADLVKETLDFRVEPKFVATLKGQGDTVQRSGLMVPVLVTGSFRSPKFRPDLQGMIKQQLGEGIPKPEQLKEMIQPKGTEKPQVQELEEKAKGLLKGLPFGK